MTKADMKPNHATEQVDRYDISVHAFVLRSMVALLVLLSVPVSGSELLVRVVDARGVPLPGAVVSVPGQTPSTETRDKYQKIAIDQTNRIFVPQVMAVAAGTTIEFPNNDTVRHHVYSFSRAKPFELKLYAVGEAPTVVFDKPGLVTIGCNIHDWMRAYIFVVDSSVFGVTDERGEVRLELAGDTGSRALLLQHPRTRSGHSQKVELSQADLARGVLQVEHDVKGPLPPQRVRDADGSGYGDEL